MLDEKTITAIKDWVLAHPELLYKGLPIALAAYITIPSLLTLAYYAPWAWSAYELYRRIPSGTIQAIWTSLKAYELVKGVI